jgi:uncharacterized lipoprotein YehR (DUF1307 family)
MADKELKELRSPRVAKITNPETLEKAIHSVNEAAKALENAAERSKYEEKKAEESLKIKNLGQLIANGGTRKQMF